MIIPIHQQGIADTFLAAESGSEMARLIGSLDWSQTPLGPIGEWPHGLRTTVSLCLASNFPINIIWGPQHTQIYNDGYRIVCGDKHPLALGMDYRECWKSAWPAIGEPFERAVAGQTSFLENQRMFLQRNGYLEETFFTFSLSPIRAADGEVCGLFHPVTETTRNMLGERRTRALRDLTAALAGAESVNDVARRAVAALAPFEFDLPFVLLYVFDKAFGAYALAGHHGVAPASAISPPLLSAGAEACWQVEALSQSQAVVEVAGLRAVLAGQPCGPYEESPDHALGCSTRQQRDGRPRMLMVLGASPRLPWNETYREFQQLLFAAMDAAMDRIATHEQEQARSEALAAADRAKTLFFSNVSHEFRTPLTLMLGPLSDALADPMPEGQRERLRIAERNAHRLLRLVNSLLDFSRIEAGRTQATFSATDLAALTAELASHFQSACAQAGLELEVDCGPLPAPVYVDRAMWEKIVLNLLSNAFKFTLEGGIRVSLKVRGNDVELKVADSGVGIPQADAALVFDRFHRVEGQRGRSMEGSGIGLSLVKEMVALHGGAVRVRSADGKGSVFSVRLKFGTDHLPADQIVEQPEPAGRWAGTASYLEEAVGWLDRNGAPPGPAREEAVAGAISARILLADDNADMRAYIQRILEKNGHQVTPVKNGREALDAIAAGPPPDLVLTDVMMPDTDGFTLLKTLRAGEATRDLVVILLSARAGPEARVEGLAAGADDYMVKPFDARELVARIDGAINLSHQRRTSAAREAALQAEMKAEERVRELAERLQFTLNAAQIGDWDLNLLDDTSQRSLRHDQCFGYTEPLAHWGMSDFFEHMHPDDRERVRAVIDAAIEAHTGWDIECRVVWPDGSVHWVAVHGSLYHVDKVATRAVGVILDITAHKQAEEELREASRRKDEFLAMLAHELRNPLAPISAAAQMIGTAKLSEERLRHTSGVIARQVSHMTALIDDLLDVSRVTRGLVDIERTPQDVHNVVFHAIEQVRPLIESKRHRLVTDLAPDVGAVMGDQKRLVQIVSNLLNNSAKYTPDGGRITVRTELRGDDVELVVEDNGTGIAPGLQSAVFELFSQAERTPDRTQGGLGLGLALVKNLVELHGGTVACHSDGIGLGSRFTVTLPRTSARGQVAPLLPSRHAEAKAGGLKIMVVDDNIDAAEMLEIMLDSVGHQVIAEHNAANAIRRAQDGEELDVAILDIGLPDLDGYELARRLRADSRSARMVLVALTGYGQASDRDKGLAAGFDHYLVKPVAPSTIINLMSEL
ncbi:PAS domain S-box-containing protein [Duganella sp. 1411]|uniref:ATP-binding protein n=1 Tax=Duganella sp. 1411 TaxID=2806572 RepID=UPI001AE9F179|nr:ATP-binding protein [Duganella sp. 1411]MBP1202700.1 PAS domain S-box-containing protein [Duganella sp. 1411]